MDESFRARVHKIFGSLSSSQSPWSLTDDEVEKREWRRDKGGFDRDDDETPCSSSFDGLFAKDRKNSRRVRDQSEDDLDDEGEQLEGGGGRGDDKDEWEIRSSIGLDSTLDNEEEEDEYDKVAEGRENAGDRLYMRNVTDHGPYLNSHNVLPGSVHDAPKDPRANHFAAKVRLNEDETEAHKCGPNQTSDMSLSDDNKPHVKGAGDGGKPKPILKRKKDSAASKGQRRVRFDPDCKTEGEEVTEKPEGLSTGTPTLQTTVMDYQIWAKNSPRVPDYVLNPAKYTRYSFDSTSEVENELNSQVCMEVLESVKMSNPNDPSSQQEDASPQLPKSITFTPRKKTCGDMPVDSSSEVEDKLQDDSKQVKNQTGFPLGIAAIENQSSEVTDMECEEEMNAADMRIDKQKPCRRYRARSKLDDYVA